jgi:hypothetical protein
MRLLYSSTGFPKTAFFSEEQESEKEVVFLFEGQTGLKNDENRSRIPHGTNT